MHLSMTSKRMLTCFIRNHVQTHRNEASTQGKDKNDCLKHSFAQYRPFYTEIIAFGSTKWPLETELLLNRGDL